MPSGFRSDPANPASARDDRRPQSGPPGPGGLESGSPGPGGSVLLGDASAHDDRRRAALAARIARQYRTITETLRVGNLPIAVTRVADLDQVLAEMEGPATGARAGWQPYWAETWDSALAVAEVLAGESLDDQRVLDLGCGLGLTGAVAAARGANVLLADAAPPALLFARLNCWPWRSRVRLRRLDWRCDRLPGACFDRVVGSDILYDPEDWPPLERFWREHLAVGGELLLGEPGRSPGDVFPDWLRSRGWQVAVSQATPPGARRTIRLFRATFAPRTDRFDAGSSPGGRLQPTP